VKNSNCYDFLTKIKNKYIKLAKKSKILAIFFKGTSINGGYCTKFSIEYKNFWTENNYNKDLKVKFGY